jgi:hypothetical protein
MLAAVNDHLKSRGIKIGTEAIMDATLISAPSSNRNEKSEGDPEMHQTRKGNKSVRRQRLWDQIGDLSNGGFLAHRNPKESEDEPEILRPNRPCASRKAGPRHPSRHAQAPFRRGQDALLLPEIKRVHKAHFLNPAVHLMLRGHGNGAWPGRQGNRLKS